MDIRKYYENNGIDYDAFLERMMGREALVEKYVRIFMADPTFSELEQAMGAEDFETAGFKAHTLKGIALNLNFEKLGNLCMSIVSSVHSGDMSELAQQFEQVKAEYACIISGLSD